MTWSTPTGNNANGIAATPDGRGLIVVQSNTGKLFRTTYAGVTTEIDLGGETVPNGDGLWLRGRTLYVVQNRAQRDRQDQARPATPPGARSSAAPPAPAFDVPTTIAEYGKRFYLPNARFTTPPTPDDALHRRRRAASLDPSAAWPSRGSVPTVVRRWVARDRAT